MNKILKKIVFSITLLFLGIGIVSAGVCDTDSYGYDDLACNAANSNGSDPFGYCPSCQFTTPRWGSGATTVVITGKNGEQITKTICSPDAAAFIDNCDVVSENFPTPLNPDGSTNEEYHEFWNNWFNQAVENGDLNENSEAAQMMAQLFCGETNGISDECKEQIKDMVAASKDDDMDFVAYPGQVVCVGTDWSSCKLLNDYVTDLCSGQYPGVNQLLCKNVAESCIAGSGTDYQGESQINEGDSGSCTYDSFNQFALDCLQTCIKESEGDMDKTAECYQKKCESSIPPKTPSKPKECGETYECKELFGEENCKLAELPKKEETGGTCGINYYSKTYSWSEDYADSCKTTHYLNEIIVSLSVPAQLNKTIYAGQGFNWGGFSGTAIVTKKVDSQDIQVTINDQKTAIKNKELEIECEMSKKDAETTNNCSEKTAAYENCINANSCVKPSKCKEGCDMFDSDCSATCDAQFNACVYNNCRDESNANANCLSQNVTDYDKKIKELTEEKEKLEEELKKYEGCKEEINEIKPTTTTYTSFNVSSATLNLNNGFKQEAGEIHSIIKNSGLSSTSILKDNAFSNNYDFFVPSNVKTSTGTLTQSVSGPYAYFKVDCDISVVNNFIKSNGINVIYRPISLSNPFPKTDASEGTFRQTRGYWSEGVIDKIILNNREVTENNVYSLTPMYTITLTPSDIKEIRKYNDTTDYNDFRMKCDNGLYCRSNFLWGFDSNYTNFNHLINYSNSCAMDNEWYSCDSNDYAAARDELLSKLKDNVKNADGTTPLKQTYLGGE